MDVRRSMEVQGMASFIPETVKRYIFEPSSLDEDNRFKAPISTHFQTVALFADVSGFTKLSERLSKRGPIGAEDLGLYLNRYLERLVKIIARSGGDVFKFAGDAMLVLWPPDEGETVDLSRTVHRVAQCCWDIQRELDNFQVEGVDGESLRVKLGVGVGPVTILHVGGVMKRLEYLAVGVPLDQAFNAEHMANPGNIIMSPEAFAYISTKFTSEPVGPPELGYQRLTDILVKVRNISLKNKRRGNGEADIRHMKYYIPAAVQPFLSLTQKLWAGELRKVTIVFANVGLHSKVAAIVKQAQRQEAEAAAAAASSSPPGTPRGTSTKRVSPDQMLKDEIQKVVKRVQECVYQYQGSLNKFLLDDKGSTVVMVFGLMPLAHRNDPERAVLASMHINKMLSDLGLESSLGITSGVALCGLIGSGSRREYTVLGDTVNLSARLMQAAHGSVLCDYETYRHTCSERIHFTQLPPIMVKGKSERITVYAPEYRPQVFRECHTQAPLHTVAREGIIGHMADRVDEVVSGRQGHSAVLTGAAGTGKSHILRYLTHEHPMRKYVRFVWARADPFSAADSNPVWCQILTTLVVGDPTEPATDVPSLRVISEHNDADDARAGEHSEGSANHAARKASFIQPVDGSHTGDFLAWWTGENHPDLVPYLCVLNDILRTTYAATPQFSALSDVARKEKVLEFVRCLLSAITASVSLVLVIDEAQTMDQKDWCLALEIVRMINRGDVSNLALWIGVQTIEDSKFKPKYTKLSEEYKQLKNEVNFVHTLKPWSISHTLELLNQHFGCTLVDPELVWFVHERSGGMPMFIAHMADMLTDKNAIRTDKNFARLSDKWLRALDTTVEFPVPYEVQRLAAMYFDNLETKEGFLLRVAAVLCIGKGPSESVFDLGMVACCHPIPDFVSSLEASAQVLLSMDLIEEVREGGNGLGTFVEESATVVNSFPPGCASTAFAGCGATRCDTDQPECGNTTVPEVVQAIQGSPMSPGQGRIPGRTIAGRSTSDMRPSAPNSPGAEGLGRKRRLFAFRFGYLRDTIYQMMLHRQRRKVHRLVATHLKGKLKEGAEEPGEITLAIVRRHQRLGRSEFKPAKEARETKNDAGQKQGLLNRLAACLCSKGAVVEPDESKMGDRESGPNSDISGDEAAGSDTDDARSISSQGGIEEYAGQSHGQQTVPDLLNNANWGSTDSLETDSVWSENFYSQLGDDDQLPGSVPLSSPSAGAARSSVALSTRRHLRRPTGFDADVAQSLLADPEGPSEGLLSVPGLGLTSVVVNDGTGPILSSPKSPPSGTGRHNKMSLSIRVDHSHSGQGSVRRHHRPASLDAGRNLAPGGFHSQPHSPISPISPVSPLPPLTPASARDRNAHRRRVSVLQAVAGTSSPSPEMSSPASAGGAAASTPVAGASASATSTAAVAGASAGPPAHTRQVSTRSSVKTSNTSDLDDLTPGAAGQESAVPSDRVTLRIMVRGASLPLDGEVPRLASNPTMVDSARRTAPCETCPPDDGGQPRPLSLVDDMVMFKKVARIVAVPLVPPSPCTDGRPDRRGSIVTLSTDGRTLQRDDNADRDDAYEDDIMDVGGFCVPTMRAINDALDIGDPASFERRLLNPIRDHSAGYYHLRQVLHRVSEWDFDIFQLERLTSYPLVMMGSAICFKWDLFRVPERAASIVSFLGGVEDAFKKIDSGFHCALRAADILHDVAYMLDALDLSPGVVPQETLYSLLIASVIINFRHPGISNQLLVSTHEERATLFNDVRVLESFHFLAAFEILRRKPTPLLSHFNRYKQQDIRSEVLTLALSVAAMELFPDAVSKRSSNSSGWDDENVGERAAPPPPDLASTHGGRYAGKRASGTASLGSVKRVDTNDPTTVQRLVRLAFLGAQSGFAAKPRSFHREWIRRLKEDLESQGRSEEAAGLPVSQFMSPATSGDFPSLYVESCALPVLEALARYGRTIRETCLVMARDNLTHWRSQRENAAQRRTSAGLPTVSGETASNSSTPSNGNSPGGGSSGGVGGASAGGEDPLVRPQPLHFRDRSMSPALPSSLGWHGELSSTGGTSPNSPTEVPLMTFGQPVLEKAPSRELMKAEGRKRHSLSKTLPPLYLNSGSKQPPASLAAQPIQEEKGGVSS